jgi:hypothetical protein
MMLHAHRLEAHLPSGEPACFVAPVPADFAGFSARARALASGTNPC